MAVGRSLQKAAARRSPGGKPAWAVVVACALLLVVIPTAVGEPAEVSTHDSDDGADVPWTGIAFAVAFGVVLLAGAVLAFYRGPR